MRSLQARKNVADLEGAYEGERYRLNVIVAQVERIDWKAIAAKLEPSRQLIAAYSPPSTERAPTASGPAPEKRWRHESPPLTNATVEHTVTNASIRSVACLAATRRLRARRQTLRV